MTADADDLASAAEPDAAPPDAVGIEAFAEDAILRFDVESGDLIYANEAARVALDVFSETYDGMSFTSLVRAEPEDISDLWWSISSGARSGWNGDLVTSDGRATPFVMRGCQSRDGRFVDLVAMPAPPAPAAAEAASGGVWDLLEPSVGFATYDSDGVILGINDRAQMALDLFGEDPTGRHHDTLWPDSVTQSPDYVNFWEKLRSGRIIEGKHEHQTGTGSTVWLQSTFVPVREKRPGRPRPPDHDGRQRSCRERGPRRAADRHAGKSIRRRGA